MGFSRPGHCPHETDHSLCATTFVQGIVPLSVLLITKLFLPISFYFFQFKKTFFKKIFYRISLLQNFFTISRNLQELFSSGILNPKAP
jgi:hypothetical protein